MVLGVRTLFAFCMVFVSGFALSDRVIFVPAGRKLLANEFRIEAINVPGRDHTFGWASFSPNSTFEFEVSGENFDTERLTLGLNGSYTLTNPITDLSPGISFGVLDFGNDTADGRALYMAVTYRLGNDGLMNQFLPTDFTIGLWSRERGLVFAGAELPFSEVLSVLGEYDGARLSAGFTLSPLRALKFKMIWIDGDPSFGLQIRSQF